MEQSAFEQSLHQKMAKMPKASDANHIPYMGVVGDWLLDLLLEYSKDFVVDNWELIYGAVMKVAEQISDNEIFLKAMRSFLDFVKRLLDEKL